MHEALSQYEEGSSTRRLRPIKMPEPGGKATQPLLTGRSCPGAPHWLRFLPTGQKPLAASQWLVRFPFNGGGGGVVIDDFEHPEA